jgi:putative DNA primase/helicase
MNLEGIDVMSYEDDFRAHIATFGLEVDNIVADREIHRFGKNKNCWYICFLDADGAGGAFGDWSQGIEEKWSSFSKNGNHDPERMAKVMVQIEESKRQHEEARKERAVTAAAEAVKLWGEGGPVDPEHPYLVKKQIAGVGMRLEEGTTNLLVPMYGSGRKMVGIQRIMEDGSKKFLYGTAKKGACSILKGQLNDRVYVAEGYATAETILMATGRTVFVAFDSGNLFPVCQQIRSKTQALIVVCGDDDLWTTRHDGTPYNAGRICAMKCQDELECAAVFPVFKNYGQKPTDFNDLMCAEGVDRVKELACDPYANRQEQIEKAVWEWVASSKGKFSTVDIDRELGILPGELKYRSKAIYDLLKSGVLEQDDSKSTVYRARDCTVNVMDISKIQEDDHVPFWLPFDLGGVVSLSPRNIVMIAGEQNAGKTTMALETLRGNIEMYGNSGKKFYYFTSEMSEAELKSTVTRFGRVDDFENCTFIDRQFEPYDLIKSDKDMQDGIVFIDYLETRNGDYSKTVSEVQKLYEAMGKGIAFVLAQRS